MGQPPTWPGLWWLMGPTAFWSMALQTSLPSPNGGEGHLVRVVKDAVDVPVVSGAGSNDTARKVRWWR